MKGFESEERNFEIYTEFNRELLELLQGRGDMYTVRTCYKMGSRILNQVKAIEELLWQKRQKRIAVINVGSALQSKWWVEMSNTSKTKVIYIIW